MTEVKNQKNILVKGIKLAKPINPSAVLEGTVIARKGNEVFVDLSPYGTGRLYGSFYNQSREVAKSLKVGDQCAVKVVGLDDGNGYLEIILQNIDEVSRWQKIMNLYRKNEILELEVKDANKGGLLVEVEGFQGFVPVSNLSPGLYPRVGPGGKEKILEHLKKFVGQKMKFVIASADPKTDKLILSERAAHLDKFKQALTNYMAGQVVEGKVVGLSPFGVFIRFHEDPPLEGLIHISEMPPEITSDLENKFKIGDIVKAKIIKIEDDRASFSILDLSEDPWVNFVKNYKIGDQVKGVVKEKTDIYAVINVDNVTGVCFDTEKLELDQEKNFVIEKMDPDKKSLILKITND